ncbi:unnamed protein product, partial [Protopolystoma xenopodis]
MPISASKDPNRKVTALCEIGIDAFRKNLYSLTLGIINFAMWLTDSSTKLSREPFMEKQQELTIYSSQSCNAPLNEIDIYLRSHLVAGLAAEKLKDFDSAITHLKSCLFVADAPASNHEQIQALQALAEIHISRGQINLAIRTWTYLLKTLHTSQQRSENNILKLHVIYHLIVSNFIVRRRMAVIHYALAFIELAKFTGKVELSCFYSWNQFHMEIYALLAEVTNQNTSDEMIFCGPEARQFKLSIFLWILAKAFGDIEMTQIDNFDKNSCQQLKKNSEANRRFELIYFSIHCNLASCFARLSCRLRCKSQPDCDDELFLKCQSLSLAYLHTAEQMASPQSNVCTESLFTTDEFRKEPISSRMINAFEAGAREVGISLMEAKCIVALCLSDCSEATGFICRVIQRFTTIGTVIDEVKPITGSRIGTASIGVDATRLLFAVVNRIRLARLATMLFMKWPRPLQTFVNCDTQQNNAEHAIFDCLIEEMHSTVERELHSQALQGSVAGDLFQWISFCCHLQRIAGCAMSSFKAPVNKTIDERLTELSGLLDEFYTLPRPTDQLISWSSREVELLMEACFGLGKPLVAFQLLHGQKVGHFDQTTPVAFICLELLQTGSLLGWLFGRGSCSENRLNVPAMSNIQRDSCSLKGSWYLPAPTSDRIKELCVAVAKHMFQQEGRQSTRLNETMIQSEHRRLPSSDLLCTALASCPTLRCMPTDLLDSDSDGSIESVVR